MSEVDPNLPAQPFVCPECRAMVQIVLGDEPAAVACPMCGRDFMVPAREATDDSAGQFQTREEKEFNALHIKHVTLERRALVRHRAYCVVAAVAFVTATMQLLSYAVKAIYFNGFHWADGIYVALGILALWPANFFYRKIMAYSEELKKKVIDEPLTPPDFSTLSDGSQHARNLEELK